MNNQDKKNLQRLQQDPRWVAVEKFFEEYLKSNFIHGSIKRDNEFETIWAAADSEGGKRHIQNFRNQLEQLARDV